MTDEDHDQTPADDVGEMTAVFRANFPQPADPGVTELGQDLPTGSALLVITRGPNAGSRLVLDKPITTAGRHPESDLYLDDVSVSRRHAEFEVLATNDVHLTDVGSLNGTYVNRQPVDSATLADGDEIQLGKFHLVFATGRR